MQEPLYRLDLFYLNLLQSLSNYKPFARFFVFSSAVGTIRSCSVLLRIAFETADSATAIHHTIYVHSVLSFTFTTTHKHQAYLHKIDNLIYASQLVELLFVLVLYLYTGRVPPSPSPSSSSSYNILFISVYWRLKMYDSLWKFKLTHSWRRDICDLCAFHFGSRPCVVVSFLFTICLWRVSRKMAYTLGTKTNRYKGDYFGIMSVMCPRPKLADFVFVIFYQLKTPSLFCINHLSPEQKKLNHTQIHINQHQINSGLHHTHTHTPHITMHFSERFLLTYRRFKSEFFY